MIVIVFIFFQPFHGSCGWIGSPTEDFHDCLAFTAAMKSFYLDPLQFGLRNKYEQINILVSYHSEITCQLSSANRTQSGMSLPWKWYHSQSIILYRIASMHVLQSHASIHAEMPSAILPGAFSETEPMCTLQTTKVPTAKLKQLPTVKQQPAICSSDVWTCKIYFMNIKGDLCDTVFDVPEWRENGELLARGERKAATHPIFCPFLFPLHSFPFPIQQRLLHSHHFRG